MSRVMCKKCGYEDFWMDEDGYVWCRMCGTELGKEE